MPQALDLSYVAINSVNPLYLITDKVNGHIEESSGYEYLTLVPTGESKDTLKNMKNCGVKSQILLGQ